MTSTAGEAVEPPRELRRRRRALRQEVDLAGAVRGRDDDLRPRGRRSGSSSRAARSTAVWPWSERSDDRVALEELVRPAGRLEQRADRGVGLLERDVRRRAVRAERVRGEVVVGEVEDEEVEAVARDEPAPDRGGVGVDRAGAAAAHGERRARPVRLEEAVEEEAASARTRRGQAGDGRRGSGAGRGST